MTKNEFKEIISFFIKNGDKIEHDFKKLNKLYTKENKKTPFYKILSFFWVSIATFTLYSMFTGETSTDSKVGELIILGAIIIPMIFGSIAAAMYKAIEALISKTLTNQHYSIIGSLLGKNKTDYSKKIKDIRNLINKTKNPLLKLKFFKHYKSKSPSHNYKGYVSNFYYCNNRERLNEIVTFYKEQNNETYLADMADILLENDNINSNSKKIVIKQLKEGYAQESEKLEEKRMIVELSTNKNKSDILSSIEEKIKINKKKSSIVLSL